MLGPLGPWTLQRKKQMDDNPREHLNRVLCTPYIIIWIYILRLVKGKMGRRCEEWFEEDGGDQLETKDTGEEATERNNWASQNSQRVVELKE